MAHGEAEVVAVHRDAEHRFSKQPQDVVRLLEGRGVEGDAHASTTVQHRSRVARDPSQPNLRQVHLLHAELLDDLVQRGHDVAPGALGENVTTRGVDLLALPTGTLVGLGPEAVVEVTGLRNPCVQIDRFSKGLLGLVARRADDGTVERLTGVMGVVLAGGEVRPGDALTVTLPDGEHRPLEPV